MKKQKTTKPFWFKDMTHQQMVDKLNTDHPVNLKYNEDLVNRVHDRYPILDKTSISIIIMAVFQSIRDLMVLGKILNFNKLFFDAKLHFFDYRKNGHILPSLKVKISTPPYLRKL
jgi:hypothetical protein